LQAMFHAEHDQRYGQAAPDERLECVNVRLVVTAGKTDTLAEQWLAQRWQPEPPVPESTRDVVFTDATKPVPTRVIWRPSLAAGARIEGPAVIEEPNATTLIHPGDVASVTEAGHLIIEIALGEAGQR
jgi:N-methylhydantoinase A